MPVPLSPTNGPLRACTMSAVLVLGLACLSGPAWTQEAATKITFTGDIIEDKDVSAVARVGDLLLIGADEATGDQKNENVIQVLKRTGEHSYAQDKNIPVFEGNAEEEMDIEALAADGEVVYVIGSHSRKRPKIKSKKKNKKSHDKNRMTFEADSIEKEASRRWLYRLELSADGTERDGSKQAKSLYDVIEKDPVLRRFRKIPSKENGVDIEGLAVKGDHLYVGFRGPVLRGGYVPVMRFAFDDPEGTYKLLYVTLDGRGIRGMASVDDGFLLIAGPVGDGPGSYQVFHWDGKDVVPGRDRKPEDEGRTVRLLDLVMPSKKAKAEGLAVLSQENDHYEVIVVYDGINDPSAQRFRIERPTP